MRLRKTLNRSSQADHVARAPRRELPVDPLHVEGVRNDGRLEVELALEPLAPIDQPFVQVATEPRYLADHDGRVKRAASNGLRGSSRLQTYRPRPVAPLLSHRRMQRASRCSWQQERPRSEARLFRKVTFATLRKGGPRRSAPGAFAVNFPNSTSRSSRRRLNPWRPGALAGSTRQLRRTPPRGSRRAPDRVRT